MAKKKAELTYGQMPLPGGRKYYKMVKWSWGGLNKRNTIDSGELSAAVNISTEKAPYLVPTRLWQSVLSSFNNLIGGRIHMYGFDDFLLYIYADGATGIIWVTYNKPESGERYDGVLGVYRPVEKYGDLPKEEAIDLESYYYVQSKKEFYIYRNGWKKIEPGESIVQFNLYDSPTDPLSGTYVKKLLIFPDKKVMDFEVIPDILDENEQIPIASLEDIVVNYTNDDEPFLPPKSAENTKYYYRNISEKAAESADTQYGNAIYKWVVDDGDGTYEWKISVPATMPDIKYATVYLSRLFGVDDERIYASGYNNYGNWTLDTVDAYNESNAWCSTAQSNTKAGGDFTGITSYQGHIICFKHDFMHELYNTKNPFRVQDIYAEGAIDNRSIQEVDGNLIFVSSDEVKVYTGGNPRIISYPLNLSGVTKAVSGTDGRNYYLYCENKEDDKRFYVYDTYTNMWTERTAGTSLIDGEYSVVDFAYIKNGMYALIKENSGTHNVWKIDADKYVDNWYFETDLITNKTVDIKHIKKLQMLADIGEEAKVRVYILYGDEKFNKEKSHLVYSSEDKEKTGQTIIRVKPKRTANYGFKLHIEGSGYVKLYEMEIEMETGGDLYATE